VNKAIFALALILLHAPTYAQSVKALLTTNPLIETDTGTELKFDSIEFDFLIKSPPVAGPGIGIEIDLVSLLQNGVFVAPIAGTYAAYGQIAYEENGNGSERSLYVVKHAPDGTTLDNIAIIETSCQQIRTLHIITLQIHAFAALKRGEYLTFNAYQNSGIPLHVIGSATWAVMVKM